MQYKGGVYGAVVCWAMQTVCLHAWGTGAETKSENMILQHQGNG